jgi:hypothetical protein
VYGEEGLTGTIITKMTRRFHEYHPKHPLSRNLG